MTSPRRAAALRPSRRAARRAVAGAALLGLALPLAACSGDAERVQAFCDAGEDAMTEITAAGSLSDDPQAFADAISEARDQFDEVEAPDEIADAWGVFTSTFADLDDSLEGIDPADQEAFTAALQEFAESADSEDLATASDDLSAFTTENCE
ncbi:hypothetical protein [Cellulomonas pakistanensis]|uniref:Lipoprotein n=1 Tax=Cellulomonas pakistanensis TaxID=992287 RepID=A0A919U372_9CELL|nr:hypothetical protein [Cellulomonas pakistanensis]GIG35981.1 hypothetical protein Cpa01nite_13620 [Cellulomonas pakistanensis]